MQSNPGVNQGNIMDLIKSQMMTMLMIKNINNTGQPTNSGISDTMYMLVITQIIDFIMKYLPIIANIIYTTYVTNNIDKYKNKINTVVSQNNIMKVKKSSITLTIRVGDQDNVIGHALMDYVTNCKNTICFLSIFSLHSLCIFRSKKQIIFPFEYFYIGCNF